jgi:DNA replication and repair protein RecF
VFILPEDIELTAGPASFHRQFLDSYISQFDKSYLNDLVTYRKVLLQRNRLLKEVAEKPREASQLDAWDKLLIEHGVRIIEARGKFIEAINARAASFYSEFNSGTTLDLAYLPKVDNPESNLTGALSVQLTEHRPREIRAGLTLVGPHRDRLKIDLNGRAVRHYGSRGQKRCVMLAMKLAVADYLSTITGNDVILILDEVFAELDSIKSQALMKTLGKHKQVFIATAGELEFNEQKIKKFLVVDGKIEETD